MISKQQIAGNPYWKLETILNLGSNIEKSISSVEWKWWKLFRLLETFQYDNIYNSDETDIFFYQGLFWNSSVLLSVPKKLMDRILCSRNMPGTDKWKLVLISKSLKSRYFRDLKFDSLPVKYHANTNSWVATEILSSA